MTAPRWRAAAGLLGGLLWIALALVPPVGTRATQEYEVLWNRLWTPALLGMLAGWGGPGPRRPALVTGAARAAKAALLAGLGLMLAGNFVEYWLLSDLPHEGPPGFARGLAWMTVLLGWLLTLLAALGVGCQRLKARAGPAWLNVQLIGLLPLTLALGYLSLNWAGAPLGLASLAAGLAGWQSRST